MWLQVFHSLLKAHALEARVVVRQALEILTPAMPGRMEDGNVSDILSSSPWEKEHQDRWKFIFAVTKLNRSQLIL